MTVLDARADDHVVHVELDPVETEEQHEYIGRADGSLGCVEEHLLRVDL